MIKKLCIPAVLLTAATLLSTNPASAVTPDAPFKATFSGTATFTSATTVSFTGTGIATLMGHLTTDGQLHITGSDTTTCPNGVANTNVETLTAPTGDTLTITSTDVACPTAIAQYHGTGQWTATGGTGRFATTTGHGTLDGTSDFTTGTFKITLTGTLTR